jgi:hypothetical protein
VVGLAAGRCDRWLVMTMAATITAHPFREPIEGQRFCIRPCRDDLERSKISARILHEFCKSRTAMYAMSDHSGRHEEKNARRNRAD